MVESDPRIRYMQFRNELLVSGDPSLKLLRKHNFTPQQAFHWACWKGEIPIADLLIAKYHLDANDKKGLAL